MTQFRPMSVSFETDSRTTKTHLLRKRIKYFFQVQLNMNKLLICILSNCPRCPILIGLWILIDHWLKIESGGWISKRSRLYYILICILMVPFKTKYIKYIILYNIIQISCFYPDYINYLSCHITNFIKSLNVINSTLIAEF